MLRTVVLTVRPSPEDARKLEVTRAAFGAACDWISGVAHAEGIFNRIRLHHRTYYEVRARFSLPAQLAVRAIGVVADTYRRHRRSRHRFRLNTAVVYDERLLRFEPGDDNRRVSLATTAGHIVSPVGLGGHQRRLLNMAIKVGQADLVCDHRRRWRLHLSLQVPDPPVADASKGILGVDLGIRNLAVDSDGTRYSGSQVNGRRRRYQRLRARLQAKGTRSARRRLRSWRGKQARFHKDTSHVVAKQIVATAHSTLRAIAVEDLNGISRHRMGKVSRDQRRLLGNWGFLQLRSFVTQKAEAAGIAVVAVDPRHTSQTCPSCGVIDSKNRPDQARFRCVSCGFAGHADTVAATNIARRGMAVAGLLVSQPDVACGDAVHRRAATSSDLKRQGS